MTRPVRGEEPTRRGALLDEPPHSPSEPRQPLTSTLSEALVSPSPPPSLRPSEAPHLLRGPVDTGRTVTGEASDLLHIRPYHLTTPRASLEQAPRVQAC
ncbi:hypothetical protein NHX12_019369 [Muraenolepis orangiensis]|uniref:Uncharacterized protein n=1 Tax=Muraenolepis orangiensis TaxID=630683 RepID=A0A9Q0ET33_9TELE|nr:hypothetical protein NHX12_019369 [Muraenolepis orangiensis]